MSLAKSKVVALVVCVVVSSVNSAVAKPLAQVLKRFSGPFTNTTYDISGNVVIELNTDTNNSVSGYINFTEYPGVSTLCGAGIFSGTIQNTDIEFTFASNDPDTGCGFDRAWTFRIVARLSTDGTILSGDYFVSNGQQGVFRTASSIKTWGNLQEIEADVKRKTDTHEQLYAKFWYCLNSAACQEYERTGEEGVSGGFNKYIFNYMATHNEGSRGTDFKCPDSALVPDAYLDFYCFVKTGLYHFDKELTPAFASYCLTKGIDFAMWDTSHEAFVKNINLPCFDKVLPEFFKEKDPFYLQYGPLLRPIIIAFSKWNTLIKANRLREEIQAECTASQTTFLIPQHSDLAFANLPQPLAPPTEGELRFIDTSVSMTLQITATSFFQQVGSISQITVTKKISGGELDITSSQSGTYYLITTAGNIASISSEGVLSVTGTSSPFAYARPSLIVIAINGNDIGLGQFAIVDQDKDQDYLADSYEVRHGLDPKTKNFTYSDKDADGLSDRLELIHSTDPSKKDTDSDQFSDSFEVNAGTDPLNADCTPISGCIKKFYLPLTRK